MQRYPSARPPGQMFVHFLIIATIAWIILYVLLHLAIDSKSRFAVNDIKEAYYISPQGEFFLLDASTITWNIGKLKATPILERLDKRNEAIGQLIESARIDADRLRQSFSREASTYHYAPDKHPAFLIDAALNTSAFDENCEHPTLHCYTPIWDMPLRKITELHSQLASIRQYSESNTVLARLVRTLSELKQNSYAQFIDASSLKVSRARSFFWTSPEGSSAEIIFFSVFGVLANLLVSSAEYLRKRNFKQNERWVAYTKLVYGPILAWILVTAIAVGWFDLGEYEVGTYSLPLIAFVLGFYSRKTVNLFQKLGDKLMGKAEESIEKGPADILAARQAYQRQFINSLRPRSISELKDTAYRLKDELVKTAVMDMEVRK